MDFQTPQGRGGSRGPPKRGSHSASCVSLRFLADPPSLHFSSLLQPDRVSTGSRGSARRCVHHIRPVSWLARRRLLKLNEELLVAHERAGVVDFSVRQTVLMSRNADHDMGPAAFSGPCSNVQNIILSAADRAPARRPSRAP